MVYVYASTETKYKDKQFINMFVVDRFVYSVSITLTKLHKEQLTRLVQIAIETGQPQYFDGFCFRYV